MKKNEVRACLLELLLVIILFFALFAPNIFTKAVVAIVMLVYMFVIKLLLKRKRIDSIYKKQVTIFMLIFALIYIGVFYLLGLYFCFEVAKISLSIWSIVNIIIPLMIIIISTEFIRKTFLQQKVLLHLRRHVIDLSEILTFIITVLVDLIIYVGMYDITKLDDFLIVLGFILFASISCNLLYNYISVRYDAKAVITYRLITTLFIYIIPVMPSVYIFFRTFLRMIYPYLIYIVLEKVYLKSDYTISYNKKRTNFVGNTILFFIMIMFVMLISCEFYYGILVIGTGSMTGTINKGDAIIFEKYNHQQLNEGQVIVFDYNGVKTIHRIYEIKRVNNEYRYYTKGDANSKIDDGYITDSKVIGLVDLRIKYIGYPKLWMRELFK